MSINAAAVATTQLPIAMKYAPLDRPHVPEIQMIDILSLTKGWGGGSYPIINFIRPLQY